MMQKNQNQMMREQYKFLFKQLLEKQAVQLDPALAEACAEVAWESMGYHTSHVLDVFQEASQVSSKKLAR